MLKNTKYLILLGLMWGCVSVPFEQRYLFPKSFYGSQAFVFYQDGHKKFQSLVQISRKFDEVKLVFIEPLLQQKVASVLIVKGEIQKLEKSKQIEGFDTERIKKIMKLVDVIYQDESGYEVNRPKSYGNWDVLISTMVKIDSPCEFPRSIQLKMKQAKIKIEVKSINIKCG